MKILKPFEDPVLAQTLTKRIDALVERWGPVSIMEVCGTHTQATARWGLRQLFPPSLRLVSGPGCPVCVTPGSYIDQAVRLAKEAKVILATFGDMVRVPGETVGLEQAKAEGVRVETVYGPHDALTLARTTRQEVVFLAVGFETTAAPIASAIRTAYREKIANLSFYMALKTIPPALLALLQDPELHIDGFLLPGHVSTVIGMKPYGELARAGGIGVIAGFEPIDILAGIEAILQALSTKTPGIQNRYPRAVHPEGNPHAIQLMQELFQPCDAIWRGIGTIPGSGLALRDPYQDWDAEKRYGLSPLHNGSIQGCACGEVLKGKILPMECPLFGRACTPIHPVGPCMVSSEGSCAAYYTYSDDGARHPQETR